MSGGLNFEFQGLVGKAGNFFRRVVRRASEINYRCAKAYYIHELGIYQRKFEGTPILVYQMGKVGSKTIVNSLKALCIERPIYHPHFLSKARIVETEEDRKQFFRTERYSYLKRPWLYEFLVKHLDKGLGSRKWKAITLTRETVSRNISAFFENLQVKALEKDGKYEIESHYYKIPPTSVEVSDLETLRRLFFERVNHDSPNQFFDREIKGVLGVDVFARDFPKRDGYCIYEGKVADILLLRLEDLNRVAPKAFGEFLDLPNFVLSNTNVGSEKDYAPLYRHFREHVDLPEDYLERMYSSRYMRHFYSPEEIEKFRRNWRSAE